MEINKQIMKLIIQEERISFYVYIIFLFFLSSCNSQGENRKFYIRHIIPTSYHGLIVEVQDVHSDKPQIVNDTIFLKYDSKGITYYDISHIASLEVIGEEFNYIHDGGEVTRKNTPIESYYSQGSCNGRTYYLRMIDYVKDYKKLGKSLLYDIVCNKNAEREKDENG